MLSEPAASVANATLRQRVLVSFSKMGYDTIDQAAARAFPLHALVLHARAREAQSVFGRNTILLKSIEQLLRHRWIRGDIDNLTRRGHDSEQN